MRSLLLERARLTPEAPALVSGAGFLSWRALAGRATAAAWRLRERGVTRGDLVAVLLENGVPLVVLAHAVSLAGGVLVPVHARLTPDEIAFALGDAAPAILVHGEGDLADAARAAALLAGVPCATACEITSAEGPGREGPPCSWREPSSTAVVLYTSGTTGRPKGAALSAGAILASATASLLHLGARPDDRWLACLPLYHVGGLSILWRAALQGAPVVLHERFDPERASRALDADGVTLVSLVPTMLARLLDARGDRPAPAALRAVLLGGGPAPQPLLERAVALGFPVLTTYGLTEAASQVTTTPLGDAGRVPVGAGVPLFGNEVRIVGPDGASRDPGESGEICVRGPSLLRGYLGRPDDTARALACGWLHTGDLGRLDEAGRLHVEGRRSDLVVSGGENVYPAEIEAVLLAHPAVSEAGVAGVPDPTWGARVAAWVVPRPGVSPPSAEELEGFCRARLAGFKVPRVWRFVDALPRNATGKLLRRSLSGVAGAA